MQKVDNKYYFQPSRDVVTPSAQAEDNQLPDMNEDSTATTSSSRVSNNVIRGRPC